MTVHRLEFGPAAVPDLKVPRMHPCQAGGIGPHAAACGATPASKWLRLCDNGHRRECWLCGSHARLMASGAAACSGCLDKGTASAARLVPVDLLLLGHAGG